VTTDRAHAAVVLAKEPVPGKVKTRFSPTFSPAESAALAGGAIADTLRAVRATRASRKVLAWDGDPGKWAAGLEVVPQPVGSLNDRLVSAFVAVAERGPVLLIGMDTPQVTAAQLDVDWGGADAVLGLSEDGGFWAIGLRGVDPGPVFDGIPMSTDHTGAAQLARLAALDLQVRLLPPLRDVDLPADADAVAARFPWLEFSRTYRTLTDARPEQPVDRLFDRVFRGAETVVCSGADGLQLDLERWSGDADPVDLLVVSRCEPPVVDLGCGPGRMLRALNLSGRPALGVDVSAVAVQSSRDRGGLALRRQVFERLPAEGRWGTVLLVDSNVGMGGDVEALLRRCRDLIRAGGLVICEVDPTPDRHEVEPLVLAGAGTRSAPVPWGRIGARTLARFAARLDLLVVEEWSAGDRVFVTLRGGG
jgi:glycosyltransferase A (GT-A) superfamily protein (DUF2064 family)/SAM-dependent methyltransferase